MSKKKKQKPQQAHPRGETLLFERPEWEDAEARLNLMEEAGRRAIAAPGGLNMRIVVPVAKPKPPVLLPARFRSVLYGPDGKPMKEI